MQPNAINDFYNVRNAEPDKNGLIEVALVPLLGMVIFPNMVTPLFVVRESAMLAMQAAQAKAETIIGVAQLDETLEDPREEDLYKFGTEIALGRLMHMPDGMTSVLAQGRRRVEIIDYLQFEPYIRVRARPVPEPTVRTNEVEAQMRNVMSLFEKCVQLNDNLPEDSFIVAMNVQEPGWLSDLIASTLDLPLVERQTLLEMSDPRQRLSHLSLLLARELEVLEIEAQISAQVQQEMSRGQREAYLREQLRAIQGELGELDIFQQDVNDLREKLDEVHLPPEVFERASKELTRLLMMPPMAPEVGIIRTYLDWLLELPWVNVTTDNLDVRRAAKILDKEHYGLAKAKDRILEHIAVRKLAPPKMRTPILCFVGPPGTGKTSLGRSIANALGREFVRVSLGGIRDEAEIRGHRRTYIGALPGRIIQTMRKAGTINPVFMLDEIDKLGHDFRGDPASALLEVLDPEQNYTFSDHYLEVPYDLSKVLFITTANSLDPIPSALLDRLEVIEFTSYTEEEKLTIARTYLIPRQLEENGLADKQLTFEDSALKTLLREYTYEAGLRNFERELANVCRKIARKIATRQKYAKVVTAELVNELLGPPYYLENKLDETDQVGVVTGIAYTENGGDVMLVEAILLPGKGNITFTGQLGEVMQESAQAAHSYARSQAKTYNIRPSIFEKLDIHVHLPETAVPKDGPSAGVTLAVALISALSNRPVRSRLAMTGEISLRGRVLPVGGIKEKVLAAYRAGIRDVILPERNRKDTTEIPKSVLSDMHIQYVTDMSEILQAALLPVIKRPTTTRATKRNPKPKGKPTTSKRGQAILPHTTLIEQGDPHPSADT